MSEGAEADERTELLGSLTTQQQQRTSARVIKKLRLETPDKRGMTCAEPAEGDAAGKLPEEAKETAPAVRQRMPKALWSADEKSLFFEALNEYGKDFDAITAYICAKLKKRGSQHGPKTKTQVSHFYYRTWHKLAKHVHFDHNVQKVAQELYALINYGELRRKLAAVSEKTCARLGEMVRGGSMAVRVRGRTLRVRTPMCAALRRLNQINERAGGTRVCSRAHVSLLARDSKAWARVQAAAHNPRLAVSLPLRTSLATFLRALTNRWTPFSFGGDEGDARDSGDELDRLPADERPSAQREWLHVGPRADAALSLPVLRPGEQLSSHKICFASYLQRMRDLRAGSDSAKMRTPKRQRKDSNSEKEKDDAKKLKSEEADHKLVNIDETAVDGIELMAHFRAPEDDRHTEDEREAAPDSASDMDDTDTDSDWRHDRLKVKFRIRPKTHDFLLAPAADPDESPLRPVKDTDEARPGDGSDGPSESKAEEELEAETARRQIRAGWSLRDPGDLTMGDLYLMFGCRSKLELEYWWAEGTPPLSPPPRLTGSAKREKGSKSPEKGDSSLEDERDRSDSDGLLSPRLALDAGDHLSGDERRGEMPASPEHSGLRLANKLLNRGERPHAAPGAFGQLTDRLKRLLALCGNPHVPSPAPTFKCACGHVCSKKQCDASASALADAGAVFRHPTPIAPRPHASEHKGTAVSFEGLGRRRRGRPRGSEPGPRVVVQRLLPLLPKLPPSASLIPVKLVPSAGPPRASPRPQPSPCVGADGSSSSLDDSKEPLYLHEDKRCVPVGVLPAPPPHGLPAPCAPVEVVAATRLKEEGSLVKEEPSDMTGLLSSESTWLSPSRLLRESDGWLEGSMQEFSLSSFLNQLEGRPDGAVEAHLQSLMADSSVDYVAKFADLAAEVGDQRDHPDHKNLE